MSGLEREEGGLDRVAGVFCGVESYASNEDYADV